MSLINFVNGGRHVQVLLAAYNGQEFIAGQIASVLFQEHVEVQIVVSDDESSDSTREVVENIAEFDPRVVLLAGRGRSASASGNFFRLIRTADLANCNYVAFCDQDDEWLPSKLWRAIECLTQYQADGYSAATEAIWPNGRAKVLSQSACIRHGDYIFEGAGQGCTFVLRVEVFKRLQKILLEHSAFEAAIHFHDWAIYALVRTLGGTWHFDSRVALLYRQHGGNDTGARLSIRGVTRRLVHIYDGWYRKQVLAIAKLVHAVNPADAAASRWLELSSESRRSAMTGRWGRLLFVACHGRRRMTDRWILIVAILCGCL